VRLMALKAILRKDGKKPIDTVLITFIIIGFAVVGVWLYYFFLSSGTVTGIFVSGDTSDWGDLCGQYPSSLIVLTNYSFSRVEASHNGGSFYFDSYYPGLNKLIPGHMYTIDYSVGWRPSDITASRQLKQFYIISIHEKN